MTTTPQSERKIAPAQPAAKPETLPLQRGPAKRPRSQREKRASTPGRKSTHPRTVDPSLFTNAEMSWLAFNRRVLDEARGSRHPLLERVKFLSIVSSNLDEFFMIRVAGVKEQILAEVQDISPDGLTPLQQIHAIHQGVTAMVEEMRACFWDDLHPLLAAAGIHLLTLDKITPNDREKLSAAFARDIFPVLTPLAFDPGHPFPYISNLSLNLAVVVGNQKGEERFARVKVPDVLPRLMEIPDGEGERKTFRFVWLEDVIADNLGLLFPGMTIRESYVFRVTRNADIEIQEDEAGDLIRSIEESIRQRRFGSVVRVGVERAMPERIRDILIENLEVTPDDVYPLSPPLGLSHLNVLLRLPRPDLKDTPYHPQNTITEDETDDMFAVIRRNDVLLHHPYDTFAPVVQFISAAARDPNVLAIKQTLYRIGKESPLIPLFIEAAENGKQVAVLVELKARFDEENNIIWAKELERAGIHVVYGLVGLKTHGKMALVVRKDQDRLRRYVHLGTGNYNPVTARLYTDYSYFTCRDDITADATEVFNYLTGYSSRETFARLAVAPVNLRERIIAIVDREMAMAKAGREAHLMFKMNSLTDPQIIEKLYAASQAGVRIDLVVRGVCCLRPGIKGISDRVTVVSIVGRFLEHSRVYYALNGGAPELYLSSADMMNRNLDRRVELMFPIEDPILLRQIKEEALDRPFAAGVLARVLQSDGTYVFAPPAETGGQSDIQQEIMRKRLASHKPLRIVPRETL
jgi:polyphosphate kinase